MKYRLVLGQLGLLLIVLSATLAALAVWGAFDAWVLDHPRFRPATFAMLGSCGVGLVIGGALWRLSHRETRTIGRREALLLVATSWIVGGLLGALPYWFWAWTDPGAPEAHVFGRFINCWFESISGLTTTGSTVLTDIERLPRELLLWRATTHWLGGLGIVVLFVAVLPTLGVGGKRLFQIESSKISTGGMHPRIADTARTLWFVYLSITLTQILALRLCGLTWFEATCESLSTISTGGFSVKNLSIAAYNSPAAEWVIITFMTIGGVNFAVYYQLLSRQFRRIGRDSELWLYVGLLVMSSLIAFVTTLGRPIVGLDGQIFEGLALLDRLRYAAFNVVSMQTCTGFATADFDHWPPLATTLMFLLVVVGGSAGSTSGGFKILRLWIALQVAVQEIGRAFRPYTVKPLRVAGNPVDIEIRLSVLAFIGTFVLIVLVGSLIVMGLETEAGVGFGTAVTACIACISNAGPGMGMAGPVENFAWFTDASKLVLTAIMIMGRLELFAALVILFPSFWRQH